MQLWIWYDVWHAVNRQLHIIIIFIKQLPLLLLLSRACNRSNTKPVPAQQRLLAAAQLGLVLWCSFHRHLDVFTAG